MTWRGNKKKHSTFCMNNLYLLHDEVFPSFLKVFALQTSYVTQSNVPALLFSSIPVTCSIWRQLLKRQRLEGAQESSESGAGGRNSRDNYIWWMARAGYTPGAAAVGYTEIEETVRTENGGDGDAVGSWRRRLQFRAFCETNGLALLFLIFAFFSMRRGAEGAYISRFASLTRFEMMNYSFHSPRIARG